MIVLILGFIFVSIVSWVSEWCDGNPLAHERVKAAVDPRLSWHASSSAGLSVFVFVSVDVAPLVLFLSLSAGGAMWPSSE